jgi:hypothetical protein
LDDQIPLAIENIDRRVEARTKDAVLQGNIAKRMVNTSNRHLGREIELTLLQQQAEGLASLGAERVLLEVGSSPVSITLRCARRRTREARRGERRSCGASLLSRLLSISETARGWAAETLAFPATLGLSSS